MTRVNFGGFLMLAIIAISLIIIFHFGFLSTASSDVGVNLSGTAYEATHNASINNTMAAFSVQAYIPYLAGVMALIFSLLLILAVVVGRRY